MEDQHAQVPNWRAILLSGLQPIQILLTVWYVITFLLES